MARDIIAQLRAQKKQFNRTENKLIDYVINDPKRARESTIQELSIGSGVSTATISRFAKKIGFDSFRDFSVALASASSTTNTVGFFGEITDDDDVKAIGQKVFAGASNALNATVNNLTADSLDKASHYLIAAKRVGFFGIGGSSLVAFNAYHKFLRTPLDVIAHPDYDIQLMQAVKLNNHDTAVVISHSGRNKDTLLIAQKLKENGVKIIAITSFADSPLAKIADLVLLSLAEEINFRSESMSSLIAQITIIDTLFTIVGSQLSQKTQHVVDTMRHVIEETRAH
ncbi:MULTISPECIES: MurR/RpiR family transcriptional regulator [Leuconostoc]|uniref:Transcription regulator n=2 Tax=Leuconostoc kimchii TaxID=136609 RepID=D5T1D8_LEUKI|nr:MULTISPECIES: MurR/RpiR family transcriptional regulator [Leuconostoc]ADG40087.1 transcription regulator [Leuconostoc kimchii IMSNU 11154]AEJ30115.1 transcription regulator [Leuconostoc sp. C2]QBR47204.1 MurR/RpiR family transcriptional regulator [Leuconostoc kimchii]